MLGNNFFPAIATHDKFVIEKALELLKKHSVLPYQYEFQMLYGVTPHQREMLVANGHAMRVYVPYGSNWFKYSTRRLKENPKMVHDIVGALFKRS
jgi:proline dehydrogenase